MGKLTYILQQTQATAEFAIICLHGLGASGDDLATLAPLFHLDHLPIRFIFPNANTQSITLSGGYEMPAWYDIQGLGTDSKEDYDGILAAEAQITELIAEQHSQGIPSHRIFLLGFSQGGAIALFTGLRYREPLAGIVALSTYLPLPDTLRTGLHQANQLTPILVAHGEDDSVVPFSFGLYTKQFLTQHDYILAWQTYPMEHRICPEEIADISVWLETHMNKHVYQSK